MEARGARKGQGFTFDKGPKELQRSHVPQKQFNLPRSELTKQVKVK